MALSGNKGEWSEAYVLLKLLSTKQIQLGDEHLEVLPGVVYPVLKIIRFEKENKTEYSFEGDIVIIDSVKVHLKISTRKFIRIAQELFLKIKSSRGVSDFPDIEEFLSSINVYSLKASSRDKTDITIQIHDINTLLEPIMGFSIKSQLGSPATLVNAGATTNFIYEVKGEGISLARVNKVNTLRSFHDKLSLINELDWTLDYVANESDVFKLNLQTVDHYFPFIISELLKLNYTFPTLVTLKHLVEKLTEFNPLEYDLTFGHNLYEMKVKRFLTDYALGMRAATVWTGLYEATGGYLVVRNDGEVLCYHFFYKNQFENYLLANTKFETASTGRHGFGTIYKQKEKYYLKLNLQIRFLV